MFPDATIESMFDAASGQARSSRARARDPRALGAGGHLRAAARAKPRRPALVVRRRPGHREQTVARRPHRLGPDAEGRLPALQGAARLRPALPERLRLPGALDRGRGRARSSGSTRSARSRSSGSRSSPRRCRDVVVDSSEALTRGSIRLGQWMDWGNDYFTFSDTNIEYIWRFLKIVHERGWLYIGHRSTEWCPRCGTSLSQHELTQSRRLPGPSRPVALRPLPAARPARASPSSSGRRRRGRCRRTSPPPCIPTSEYGLRENGEWVAVALVTRTTRSSSRVRGTELVGCRYRGPFDDLAPGAQVEHRVDPVGRGRSIGAGHRHRPHRARLRRRGLRARPSSLDLAVLTPVDEAGRFYDDYGWLHGLSTHRGRRPDRRRPRRARASSSRPGSYTHAYPHCWRCDTPLIFRLSDDWFIARRRDPPTAARGEREGRVGAGVHGQAHGRLAAQHGRLEHLAPPLLRPAAAVLPVLVRAPERDRLEGRARGAGGRGPRPARGAAPAVDRPRADPLRGVRRAGRRGSSRSATSGSTPGIVPFSTLGWENPEWVPEGYATGAAQGLTKADLPDHAYWEKWFPADWVSEMREQIRLWFYSQFFMSVVLVGRSPYRRVLGYEKMLDEHGREMHGSWGNMIAAEDAFARMGADVMRWQYCAQPPDRNLLFGFGPAHEIKRKLLTFWNSVEFLVDYGNIEGFEPDRGTRLEPDVELRPLDRWLVERTHELVARGDRRLRGDAHGRRDPRVRGVRRRPLELVHPPLAPPLLRATTRPRSGRSGTRSSSRCASIAPVMPFLADHLWRNLVPDGPASVHLAGWPEPAEPDRALLDEIAEVRARRRARPPGALDVAAEAAPAAAAARRRRGARAPRGHADEIADELRVKEVEFGDVEASELRVKPNLPVLGPKLGTALREVRERLAARRVRGARRRPLPGRRPRARAGRGARRARRPRGLGGRERGRRHGRARHGARRRAVPRGALLDLIHEVQRPAQGVGPRDHRPHPALDCPTPTCSSASRDRIAAETLAVSVELGELRLEKA